MGKTRFLHSNYKNVSVDYDLFNFYKDIFGL